MHPSLKPMRRTYPATLAASTTLATTSDAVERGAVLEHDEAVGNDRRSHFVVGEGRRGDDGDAVARRRELAEVDGDAAVDGVGGRERRLPHDVVEPRRAVREEMLAVGQEVVEGPVTAKRFGGVGE